MSSPNRRRVVLWLLVLILAVLAVGWWYYSRRPASQAGAVAAKPAVKKTVGSVVDFRVALDNARKESTPARRARSFGELLRAWLAREPEAALAYVRALPPGAERTQGLLMVLAVIGQKDAARALILAAELASNREQRAIYHVLFAQLAKADAPDAVKHLSLVPAGEPRENAVRALADEWALTDFSAALAWAKSLPPAERTPALEATLTALISTDPLHAAELAQQLLAGPALDRTMGAALRQLTISDLPAAAALVVLLPESEERTFASLDVARAMAAKDPGAALAWSKTLPGENLQGLALNTVLESWAAKDPVAAGQYVAQMSAGPAQDVAVAHLARLLAATDPARALVWAQSFSGDSVRALAVVDVTSAWAKKDPVAASQWAQTVADPALKTDVLRGTLSYWVLQDSEAARSFVSNLSGETQVQAAEFLAPRIAQQDPVAALAWTQTLLQPAARDAALAAAYARWAGNAPAAAKAWLASANLPAATKARLTK